MVSQKYTVRITRSIKEIAPQDWNAVFPREALENYNFFKALDESDFEGFSFYYILVYDNGKPVAATSCFTVRFAVDIMAKGALKSFCAGLRKIVPGLLSPKVLMCGLPMGPGRIGIADNHAALLQIIEEAIDEIARKEKAPLIFFKDFTDGYASLLEPLLPRGYNKLQSIPSTVMDLNFSSFEDYLKTLSPSSREGLRRKFKKIDGKVSIDFECTTALDETTLDEAHTLYLQTYDKMDVGLEKVPKEFFRNISKYMPDETRFFLWRIKGKMVAFAFCLVRGDYFIDYYLGFDYSVAFTYNLYYIRFRDLLNWCLNHGIKKYEMGVTAYEPKRRLGFSFVRYYFYIRHRNRIVNRSFGPISYFLKPERFEPVFKDMARDTLPA